MKKASVVVSSGDAIAIFREIKSVSPHGRYEIKVFPTYIHLHGKTFDYKIAASSVTRLDDTLKYQSEVPLVTNQTAIVSLCD